MRKLTLTKFILWAVAVLAVTAIAYWLYQNISLRGPSEFTIATGWEGGAYAAYADEYAAHLAERDVKLHLQPSAGSVETMRQLVAREAPVGFVQSGAAEGFDTTGLYSLGSLFYEPIFVFYRTDRFDPSLERLVDLRGRDIAIGDVGSGTNHLARQMLQENDVTGENSNFVEVASPDAYQMLVDSEVDAAFFVMAPKAELLFDLLLAPDVEMMGFRRASAYESRFPFLTKFVVGEGTVDLVRNIPDEDKTILATTATLLANELLHPDSARQLLTAAVDIHSEGGYFEEEGEFPSIKNTELPVPTNIQQFLEVGPSDLEKYLPLSLASAAERFIFVILPLLVILYPLFRSAPPLFSWVFRYQIYRWYQRLRRVELGIDDYALSELNDHIDEMLDLQAELTRRIRVPLFYQQDFYNLRMHLRLVIDRLEQRRDVLQAEETTLVDDAQPADGALAATPTNGGDLGDEVRELDG